MFRRWSENVMKIGNFFQNNNLPTLKNRSRHRRSRSIQIMSAGKGQNVATQKFDFFLVLDFEATCDNKQQIRPQEIIEFPVLKINGKTFEVESQFHRYVRPQIHPELTSFCTELTGIIQEMVDDQPPLESVLTEFDNWLKTEGLYDSKFAFVTCGDWDLKIMLPSQARYFNINYPVYLKAWINIKKPFCDVTGQFPRGMTEMLKKLELVHKGRLHSGIDDCYNIANILQVLAMKGYVFQTTGKI